MSNSWQSRPSRGRFVTAATAVVLLAGAGTAWGLTRGSGPSYRSALAANGTVMQTLAATGTVSPVSHASQSFQVGGTVAHVAVTTGQRVHAGQVLGYLNRSALRSELRSARSQLASARSRMSADESGQSAGTAQASRGSSAPTLESSQPQPQPPSHTQQAQAAVRVAQQATDQALSEASRALQATEQACASSAGGQSTPATTSSPEPSATASPAPGSGDTTSNDACTTAGAALLSVQQQVDRDEQQVAAAEAALTKLLSSMSAAASKGSQSTTPSRSSSDSSRGATSVSAADIALDQASIDQAQAAVYSAAADLGQATLRATISGRVAAVTVARGDQVSASSSEPAFVLVGSKQEQTTIDLSATEIRDVKVGMTAHVVADGSSSVVTGQVVAVNSAGTTSSTGAVTFPVTITLPDGTNVVSGAAASVTLVIASLEDVLTVPTSAVHYSGTTAYVELLRNGKEVRRTVKVGAMGAALTQVTSGLSAGDRVVLADLNAAVPSSSSSLTGGGGFLGGRGAGAGFVRRFVDANGSGAVTFGGPAG